MSDTEKNNLSNLEKKINQEEENKIETPDFDLNQLNSNEIDNKNNKEIKSNKDSKEKESQNEVNENEGSNEENEIIESDIEEKNNIVENKEEKKETNTNINKKIPTEDLLYEEEPQIEHLTINEQEQVLMNKESNVIPTNEKNNYQNNKTNQHKNNEENIQSSNNKNKNNFKELSALETSEIASNLDRLYTQVFNVSKNTITNNNISDTEQLKLDFVKESSKLQPNKNDNFMMRMTFDIMKRQTQERRLENIIEKTKNKMDENQRIKGFNRLIEDANRRLEAQEQLNTLKKKLEEKEDDKPLKKYKQEQWANIYNDRFKQHQIKHDEKIKSEIDKKNEEKKIEEENEIKMCKVIKKPMKNIIEYANKMYEEAKKRNKIKENKINYDKYVKDINNNKNNNKNINTNNNKIQKQTIISLTKNNKIKNPNLNNQTTTQNKELNQTHPKKKHKNELQISLENLMNKVNNEKGDSYNKQENIIEKNEITKEPYNQVNKSARVRIGKIENPNRNSQKNMANKIVDEFFLKNLYH